MKPFLVMVLTYHLRFKSRLNMRHRDVLEIRSSSECLLSDSCGLWVTSWCTDLMSLMLLTVRDRPGCCLSATVLSALNFNDNKANTAMWGMIFISNIPSECSSLYSYIGMVALKIKLNNWSLLNYHKCFYFLGKRKNIMTLSIFLPFSVCMIRANLFIFSFWLMLMELSYDLYKEIY